MSNKLTQAELEQMAVNRYRPVPDGLMSYKVLGGDGSRSLFKGTKSECQIIARKLTEAFLDGIHIAFHAVTPDYSAPPTASQLVARALEKAAQYVDGMASDEDGRVILTKSTISVGIRALIDQPVEQG